MSDPATFVGVVTEDGNKLLLDFPQQFKAFYRRFAGHEVELEIRKRRVGKTRQQERGFHAMITPWAMAEGHRIDDLKIDLLGEIFGWREQVSPLTGKQLPVEMHTSTLTREQYSTLIERTLEIAAGCGQVLEAPHEYRERKERAAKAAAQKAAREARRAAKGQAA